MEENDEKLSDEVDLEDLRAILPPLNDLDFVETNRLVLVRARVLNLLKENTSPAYRSIQECYLGHLGATEVLEYLPKK